MSGKDWIEAAVAVTIFPVIPMLLLLIVAVRAHLRSKAHERSKRCPTLPK